MDPVNFFSIASQQNRWLSVRGSVVAQNIANVNTPGFKALDVEPFDAVLSQQGMEMARTQVNHMTPQGRAGSDVDTAEAKTWDVVHSGNSVNIEEQLLKSGEVSGAYARNTTVMKAFHRMLMSSTRG